MGVYKIWPRRWGLGLADLLLVSGGTVLTVPVPVRFQGLPAI